MRPRVARQARTYRNRAVLPFLRQRLASDISAKMGDSSRAEMRRPAHLTAADAGGPTAEARAAGSGTSHVSAKGAGSPPEPAPVRRMREQLLDRQATGDTAAGPGYDAYGCWSCWLSPFQGKFRDSGAFVAWSGRRQVFLLAQFFRRLTSWPSLIPPLVTCARLGASRTAPPPPPQGFVMHACITGDTMHVIWERAS